MLYPACRSDFTKCSRNAFARSPVFRAMLSSDMRERQAGIIRIDDAGLDVVRQMLRYMYTAKIQQGFNRIKELLVLANKYQVF